MLKELTHLAIIQELNAHNGEPYPASTSIESRLCCSAFLLAPSFFNGVQGYNNM